MTRLIKVGLGCILAAELAAVTGAQSYVQTIAPKDMPPRCLQQGVPTYPTVCRVDGVEGQAVIDFVVDPRGCPVQIKVVKATRPEFGLAAEAAVAGWLFEPGRKEGVPVAVYMQIPIVFSLKSPASISIVEPAPALPEDPSVPVVDAADEDVLPAAIRQGPPQYPYAERKANHAGQVVVDFVVDEKGVPCKVRAISSPSDDFAAAAVNAVSGWRFRPGQVAGIAVRTHMQVPIAFSLNSDEGPSARMEEPTN